MVVLELLFYLALLGALGTAPLVMWLAGVVMLQARRSSGSQAAVRAPA
jgi:hypothetical protein